MCPPLHRNRTISVAAIAVERTLGRVDGGRSPDQVIWDGKAFVRFVGVRAFPADARCNEGGFIALANASRDRRGYQIVTSFVPHDSNLTASEPITHRRIDCDTPNLAAIDKIVVLAILDCR
jgi:hypothetical protein